MRSRRRGSMLSAARREAEQARATLEIRQVWLDSLLADRRKVQEIMDHQARDALRMLCEPN